MCVWITFTGGTFSVHVLNFLFTINNDNFLDTKQHNKARSSEPNPLAVRPGDPVLAGHVRGGVLHSELVVAVGVHARVAVTAGAPTAPRLTQCGAVVGNLGINAINLLERKI